MKNLLALLLLFLAIPLMAQKSDSLYFDVTLFKKIENRFVIDPPYDKIKRLEDIPPGRMRDTSNALIDTPLVQILSQNLETAGERSFYNNSTLKRNYRFTWLRSFNKQIVINIFEEQNATRIETKWFSRSTGIDSSIIQSLSLNVINEFEAILDKNTFWSERQTPVADSGIYVDGSMWLLEASKNKKYHFIFRRSPTAESAIRKISEWLIMKSSASNETKIY